MNRRTQSKDTTLWTSWPVTVLTFIPLLAEAQSKEDFPTVKQSLIATIPSGGLPGGQPNMPWLLISLVLLTVVLAWSLSLRRRVYQQTRDLLTQLSEREKVEQQLRDKTEQLSAIFAASPDMHLLLSADGKILSAEGGSGISQGPSIKSAQQRHIKDILPISVGRLLQSAIDQVLASNQLITIEYALSLPQGERWFEARLLPFANECVMSIARDITQHRRSQDLNDAQRRILELITRGSSQEEILTELCRAMEKQLPQGAKALVFFLKGDGRTLNLSTSPSSPRAIIQRFNGLSIGSCPMGCGDAVYPGRPIVVEDIIESRPWDDYREFALANGIRACWSMPIFSKLGNVIGNFAIALPQPRKPAESDLEQLSLVAQLAGLAIEHSQAEQRLHQAAAVFENTVEGVIITDARANIIAVNKAFTLITGYTETEVLGNNPKILKSGCHEWPFYAALWKAVVETGHWQGEIWNRRKSGEIYPQWSTISSVFDGMGTVTYYVSVFADISSIKQSQERLNHLAHHDPLTGLPNRLLLNARLKHALQHAQRQGSGIAVLFLDLDQFKNINDTLGHTVGDELLREVAKRLSECVRTEDTVARLGGDEFVVTMENLWQGEGADVVVRKILAAFSRPFTLEGQEMFITASVGISLYPEDGESVDELLRNADAAMYRAKSQGRNTYEFYTRELTIAALEKFTLETSLRYALQKCEFVLYYQPQISLQDGQIVGVEALIRWQHPRLGLLSPVRFIRLAEETGLINPIGEWVLRAACIQAKTWQEQGLPAILMAVNLSGRQIVRDDLVGKVRRILDETGLDPRYLELEITEDSMMDQRHKATANLDALKALGVTLTIDDFGTGYSSMSYLKRFSVDKLKIDKSFVRDITNDPNDQAIIRAIIAMCHTLQLKVVAEGVETSEQRAFLVDYRCNQIQGYLFSPPVTAEACAAMLGEMNQVGTVH